MINFDHRRYFIAESGLILEQAEQYRKDYTAARRVVWDYVQNLGGTAYQDGLDGGLGSIKFPGKPPFGFKQTEKDGLARPRLGSAYAKEFAQLPRTPKTQDYLSGVNYITGVRYKPEPDAPEGEVPIGHPGSFTGIDWFKADGPLLVIIPDQALTCAALKRKFPDIIFLGDEDKHDPDTTGLREILLKEWELMEEKHKRGMPT